MTFLQRVEILSEKVRQRGGNLKYFPSPHPTLYSWLSSPHFVSGEVRYIGYTFAEIGSRMMASFVTDEIEKVSGRRSWNQQPGLSSIFTDRFYKEGWKYLVPANIEKITGRKFDAEAVVSDMARVLNGNAPAAVTADELQWTASSNTPMPTIGPACDDDLK